MTVTVLDNKGTTVGQLPEEAFTITEDGSPRPVAHFARGMVPLSIVVALDASESMRGGRFDLARRAVKGFIDRLGPEDEFTLIGFNDQPFTIAPGSTNPETIVVALNRVEPQGYTALYAAVSTALDDFRGSRNRRQALVIISDGNDQLSSEHPGTRETRRAARQRALPAIERMQHSEATVYAIGVDARDVPQAYRLDPDGLRVLTDPSGGSTRIVETNAAIVAAAERIGDELRHQYVLGFTPAHPGDGKFHKVQVAVSGCPKCQVRTRAGYIADQPPAR